MFAWLAGPKVQAQNRRDAICKLLDHPLSHWRERHFDISETALMNRALGEYQKDIPPVPRGYLSSKYNIPENEMNDLIAKNLSSARGQTFLDDLNNLGTGPADYRDFQFNAGKSVGYGYVLPKDSNGLNKINNLEEVIVRFRKSADGKVYIATTYPTK
jgi:hypothetical protein